MNRRQKCALRLERIKEDSRRAAELKAKNPSGSCYGSLPLGVHLISPDDDSF